MQSCAYGFFIYTRFLYMLIENHLLTFGYCRTLSKFVEFKLYRYIIV
jgi:hypothetical protein